MTKISGLILCEGETDQALIGSFLEHTNGWIFFKNNDSIFPKEKINWFKKSGDNLLGIWQVGGCNFLKAVGDIAKSERYEAKINRVAIVTDYDDSEAKTSRIKKILTTFKKILSVPEISSEDILNQWESIEFTDRYKKRQKILLSYLLVPSEKQGALETFMLDSLLEQDEEKENVILQSREFVNQFSSEKYLTHKREKIKAELGVSLSIFSPDRVFTTTKELIDSIDWSRFDTANEQFGLLKEI